MCLLSAFRRKYYPLAISYLDNVITLMLIKYKYMIKSVGGIKMFQDNFINQMIRLILKELKGEKQYARIASVMYPETWSG